MTHKKKLVSAVAISLLPEGYEKKVAENGCKKFCDRKGHYVLVINRRRTYWRSGSGVRIISEHFETFRKWVEAAPKGGR